MAGRRGLTTPAARLALVLVVGVLATLFATRMALDQPRIEVVAVGQSLTGGGAALALEPLDLSPEPGEIIDYPQLARFYARQDRLSALMAAPYAALQGRPLGARRGLGDLPVEYWVQLAVGFGALLISGWVWALRPRDLASGLFALSGLSTLAFTLSAAVYSTRALALPSGLFQALTLANGVGATVFGAAMIGLFLIYPRRLKFWRPLILIQAAVFVIWTALAVLRWLPSGAFGGNFITLVEMGFILVAIAAQYVATRRQPEARAALTWLGLSVIFGAGGFILLSATPAAMGLELPISQAYAFGFFLLIYLGLAAGLRRYRLFDVGEWGLRAAFYALGAAAVMALDGALLVVFGLDRAPAFSLAILATALLYLPFRDQLWRLATRRKPIETHDALASALDVAFTVSPAERTARWTALLQRVFDPLLIEPASDPVAAPRLDSDGVGLSMPSVAGVEAMQLSHPHAGRALFRPADLKLAVQLTAVVERAEQGRQAYDRGVKEERRRVAQDLHDDVGARLLTGLHSADAEFKPTLQAAISDIRAIVSGIAGERATLEVVLGNMRYEVARRLEGAGLELDWPLIEIPAELTLDYRPHKALTSAVREAVSNVVRHAGATRLGVRSVLSDETLTLCLADDGKGLPAEALAGEAQGFGMKSLKRRMQDIGGAFEIASSSTGTTVTLTIPLQS